MAGQKKTADDIEATTKIRGDVVAAAMKQPLDGKQPGASKAGEHFDSIFGADSKERDDIHRALMAKAEAMVKADEEYAAVFAKYAANAEKHAKRARSASAHAMADKRKGVIALQQTAKNELRTIKKAQYKACCPKRQTLLQSGTKLERSLRRYWPRRRSNDRDRRSGG